MAESSTQKRARLRRELPMRRRQLARARARAGALGRRIRNIGSALRLLASDDHLWGGSRAVTNEIVRIVGKRAPVTSRKRAASDPLSKANPGSDHNEANTLADAVDFGIAEAYALARELAAKLGAPNQWSGDYDSFTVRRNGHSYRVQIIAGTHGTGPHLHVGVERIS